MREPSITALQHYLNGFQSALCALGRGGIEKLFPLPFQAFHDYVGNHYKCETAIGWIGIILEETNHDEEKSFSVFCELFDRFKSLSIDHCSRATLSRENIEYHYRSAPKEMLPPDYQTGIPLYVDPTEIYIVKLTDSAGYMYVVKSQDMRRARLRRYNDRWIYKRKSEVERYVRECFGPSLDWKAVKMDNFEFRNSSDSRVIGVGS